MLEQVKNFRYKLAFLWVLWTIFMVPFTIVAIFFTGLEWIVLSLKRGIECELDKGYD